MPVPSLISRDSPLEGLSLVPGNWPVWIHLCLKFMEGSSSAEENRERTCLLIWNGTPCICGMGLCLKRMSGNSLRVLGFLSRFHRQQVDTTKRLHDSEGLKETYTWHIGHSGWGSAFLVGSDNRQDTAHPIPISPVMGGTAAHSAHALHQEWRKQLCTDHEDLCSQEYGWEGFKSKMGNLSLSGNSSTLRSDQCNLYFHQSQGLHSK